MTRDTSDTVAPVEGERAELWANVEAALAFAGPDHANSGITVGTARLLIAEYNALVSGVPREQDERLREALGRIIAMCDVPARCTCGRPNGIPAVVLCARAALRKVEGNNG